MKRFKNKAEEMHYLLHPREVERRENSKGEVYRIWDCGNHIIGHIFEIERRKMYGKCEVWESVSKNFIEWKKVSDELNKLLEN